MKKNLLLISVISLFSIITKAQCPTGRYIDKTFAVDTIKNVLYGSNTKASGSGTENLLMDIYVPRADTMAHRPMIIYAHGGSFIGGDRRTSDMTLICHTLAARGYVTASIEYRLESPINLGNTQKMVTEVIRSQQDGKAAIRFFRKDASSLDAYRIDSTQIFFGGTSAGGILALHLAYMNDSDPLPTNWVTWANSIGGIEGTSGNPGHSSAAKAIVTYAGGSFSSRVAGSLLYDLELTELATGSYTEYKEKDLSLAIHSGLRNQLKASLKSKLNANNWPVKLANQVVAFINTLGQIE